MDVKQELDELTAMTAAIRRKARAVLRAVANDPTDILKGHRQHFMAAALADLDAAEDKFKAVARHLCLVPIPDAEHKATWSPDGRLKANP